jgi:hypothetical protein
MEAGSWAAEDCAPEDFDGAFPSGWSCEGSPYEPTDWHGWEEQKRGLSGALLALDLDDAPVAVSVFVSASGTLDHDGDAETLSGP